MAAKLAEEVRAAPFSVPALTNVLWGPRELEAKARDPSHIVKLSASQAKAFAILEGEPLLLRSHYDLSVPESRRLTMKKILRRMQMTFDSPDVERVRSH